MRPFKHLARLVLAATALMAAVAYGQPIPQNAHMYLPLLVKAQTLHWGSAPNPWILAAQVEKESCVSLKHRRCWTPYAELKTSRENGVGLGQITRAYNDDGSIRFDAQAQMREQYPLQLGDWTWDRRYEPEPQLVALVLMNRGNWFRLQKLFDEDRERWAATLSAYNGGLGHVLKDRQLCQKMKGCDSSKWFQNVEKYSVKSKAKWKGYGASAFETNRRYPRVIMERAPDYRLVWFKLRDSQGKAEVSELATANRSSGGSGAVKLSGN